MHISIYIYTYTFLGLMSRSGRALVQPASCLHQVSTEVLPVWSTSKLAVRPGELP